jgi:hypothetical protein
MDLGFGSITDECIEYAKDRWNILLDFARLVYRKQIADNETLIIQLNKDFSDDKRGDTYYSLRTGIERAIRFHILKLEEIDNLQKQVDENVLPVIYNQYKWESQSKKVLADLDGLFKYPIL